MVGNHFQLKYQKHPSHLPDDPGDRAEGPGEGFMVLVGCGGRWLPEMYLLSRLSKLLEPASSS